MPRKYRPTKTELVVGDYILQKANGPNYRVYYKKTKQQCFCPHPDCDSETVFKPGLGREGNPTAWRCSEISCGKRLLDF